MRTVPAVGVTLVVLAIWLSTSMAMGANGGRLVVQRTDLKPLPASAAGALARVDGVRSISAIRTSWARQVETNQRLRVTGIDPKSVEDVFPFDWTDGSPRSVASLDGGNVVAARDWAARRHKHVGSRFELITAGGAHMIVIVRGIYEDRTGHLADLTLDNRALELAFGADRTTFLMASVTPGEDLEVVHRRAARALRRRYPELEVLTQLDDQPRETGRLPMAFYGFLSAAAVGVLLGGVTRARARYARR